MPVYERNQIQCPLLKADKRLFVDWCAKCCVAMSLGLWVPNTQHLRLPLKESKAACILLHFTNQTGTRLAHHRFCNLFKGILSLRKMLNKNQELNKSPSQWELSFHIKFSKGFVTLQVHYLHSYCLINLKMHFLSPHIAVDFFVYSSLLDWLKTLKSSTVTWIEVHWAVCLPGVQRKLF